MSNTGHTVAECTGLVLVDKQRNWRSLSVALLFTLDSPEDELWFYSSGYRKGVMEGDKDAHRWALLATGAPFSFVTDTAVVGHIQAGVFAPCGILMRAPDGTPAAVHALGFMAGPTKGLECYAPARLTHQHLAHATTGERACVAPIQSAVVDPGCLRAADLPLVADFAALLVDACADLGVPIGEVFLRERERAVKYQSSSSFAPFSELREI